MSHSHRQLLDDVAKKAQEMVQAETSVIVLTESSGETVYFAAAVGKHADKVVGRRGPAATAGLCNAVLQNSAPVLVYETEGDSRVRQDYVQALGIKTALAVPIYYQGKLLGALMALNRSDNTPFDQQAEQILTDYASEAGVIVHQYQESFQE